MGRIVSDYQPDVAPELGAFNAIFRLPADIRKVIYTTNAVESLNMSLRKVIKTRGSFPNQEAAFKLLYRALEHIAKKWTMPIQNWKAALQRFAILLGDRVPKGQI
jgi:putative transposase